MKTNEQQKLFDSLETLAKSNCGPKTRLFSLAILNLQKRLQNLEKPQVVPKAK